MPLTKGKNKKDCVSKNISIEVAHGKSKEEAVAISLSHCRKIYGGDD